jgi:hypothetical protein
MTNPTLEERKNYWKWVYATKCFEQVKSSFKFIRQNPNLDQDVAWVFISGIVVTYSKPFTASYGVGVFDERIISRHLLKDHNQILDFRHRIFAHIDAVNFKADDPNFGNLNQVVISKGRKKYGCTLNLIDAVGFLQKIKIDELCCDLIRRADYQMRRFERKYVAVREFPTGDYLLNIDPQKTEAFIPNPKLTKLTGQCASDWL